MLKFLIEYLRLPSKAFCDYRYLKVYKNNLFFAVLLISRRLSLTIGEGLRGDKKGSLSWFCSRTVWDTRTNQPTTNVVESVIMQSSTHDTLVISSVFTNCFRMVPGTMVVLVKVFTWFLTVHNCCLIKLDKYTGRDQSFESTVPKFLTLVFSLVT